MTKNDFRDLQLFMLSDRLTYETMDRYVHRPADFEARAAARLDASWTLGRKGSWLNALPAGARLPLQGWKIHLSARLADADGVLDAVLGVLVPLRVPFKFLLDRDVLRMTNSKSWSRGGSGKFVTVYPKDEAEFRALLEALHAATSGFQGPYILSDRRYASSRVVFYRFGGITPNMSLGAGGRKTPLLVTPSGASVPDVRTPFFELPSWVSDLFPETAEEGGDLLDGRYAVESSLGFSSSGGVYLAKDSVTGRKVVLKEARPWVNETEDGRDIVALLEGEYAILRRLEGAAAAPAALGLFREWEHTFLAQEYLDGYIPLAKWSSRHDLILRTRFSADEARSFLGDYARIFVNLAEALKALHGRGVLFGDFSANNVMLDPETLAVRLIDFEGARLAGDLSPAAFFTPGFSDPRRAPGPLTAADDYYAFGANMLYALARVGPLEGLKAGIAGGWLEHLAARFALPPALTQAVAALTHPDPAARPAPWELTAALREAAEAMPKGEVRRALPDETASPKDFSELLDGILSHLGSAADLGRKDRLWPASPEVFQTNPYNLAYGACGVLDVLRRTAPERAIPALWDWVRRAKLSPRDVPPGLQTGFAGVAWAL
ncbi:MAG: Membrane translocator, partial [Elusimicrobia bacterium]